MKYPLKKGVGYFAFASVPPWLVRGCTASRILTQRHLSMHRLRNPAGLVSIEPAEPDRITNRSFAASGRPKKKLLV